MMMRCRYSRRLYILKSQFHNPDYIDDEDFSFLENLIIFHTDYVNKCGKAVYIDSSLLDEKYRLLFKKISNQFPQITHNAIKTDLYKSFDLEYKGEERHIRNLREQIINYLQHKKGHIFTNRRVEFFLKLSMTTARDELKRLCKEMLFSIKSPRRSNLGMRKKDSHKNSLTSTKEVNKTGFLRNIDLSRTRIETLETLFLPYITMTHPPNGFDFMKVDAMIKRIFPAPSSKSMISLDNKDKELSSEGDRHSIKQNRHSHPETVKTLPAKDQNLLPHVNMTARRSHPKALERKIRQSSSIDAFAKTTSLNKNTLSDSLKPPFLSSSKRRHQNSDSHTEQTNTDHSTVDAQSLRKEKKRHRNPITTSQEFDVNGQTKKETADLSRDSRLRKRQQISHIPLQTDLTDTPVEVPEEIKKPLQVDKTMSMKPPQEVIEISDDEDCFHKKISSDVRDIDQMIDFLIHRCTIQPHLHQTLLKDHQLRIELNGFLLFVNLSIRLSLKVALEAEDKKLFDCVFISSIVVGLDCSVYMNEAGINIDKLSNEHLKIALARISSAQVPVRDVSRVGDHNSIHINPDISKLVQLAMFYVDTYHASGRLVPTADVPA